jgi:hypothetical protein
MPPIGKVRFSYGIREQKEIVEVLLDGEVVCQLPATEIRTKFVPGTIGIITVDLIAERVDGEGHA